MKFGKKDFSEHWKIIKIPTLILIAWSVLGFLVSMFSFTLYTTIFSVSASWLLMIVMFAFIGWSAVKDHKGTVKTGAWAGALSGVISGFIGAIIGILMFYLVPDLVQFAISQAGANAAAIESFLAIGVYIGLVTGPLFSGIIGAIISSIAALIAKKV